MLEVERKWLMTEDQFRSISASLRVDHRRTIVQCYIPAREATVRLRLETFPDGHRQSVLCVKQAIPGNSIACNELEYQIDADVAASMMCHRPQIVKVRWAYGPYEIDVFQGNLNGLIIAEREYESEQDAMIDDAPNFTWCEVTNDRAYKNVNLVNMEFDQSREAVIRAPTTAPPVFPELR